MTSGPWAFTNTSWITWEDIAEQPGLLAGAHSCPDKWKQQQNQEAAMGTWSVLLESPRSLWKTGFPTWSSHSRSGRSYALSSHLIPGCCGTACAPAGACPSAAAAAWPFPHALTVKHTVPERWHRRLPQSLWQFEIFELFLLSDLPEIGWYGWKVQKEEKLWVNTSVAWVTRLSFLGKLSSSTTTIPEEIVWR